MKKIVKSKKRMFSPREFIELTIIITIFLVMQVQLPYTIYSPGGLLNINERLTGDVYKSSGSINLTYVTSRDGTVQNVLTSFIVPSWDLIENDDIKPNHETIKSSLERARIQMKEAISNATKLAYEKAGKDITLKEKHFYVTYITDNIKTELKVGDELLEIDNHIVNDFDKIKTFLENKKENEEISIKVKRDDKEKEVKTTIKYIDGEPKIGISLSFIDEYELNPKISYTAKSSEAGPSGGLMISLAIYNGLVKEDITKGINISGTGTIASDGTVGEISGVKYKISGAVKKKSEVFICPEENYKEALKEKEKNKYDIKIIKVKTFDEAIEKIKLLKK